MNEICIRCNKPTPYHTNTPITLRRYYVEGSGQLCEQCFYELYPLPRFLQSKMGSEERSRVQENNIPNKR